MHLRDSWPLWVVFKAYICPTHVLCHLEPAGIKHLKRILGVRAACGKDALDPHDPLKLADLDPTGDHHVQLRSWVMIKSLRKALEFDTNET